MCGRLSLHARPEEVAHVFGVDDMPQFESRYNIAPSEAVGVVKGAGQGRVHSATKWGLIPHQSRESQVVPNARAETVATTPWFRDAFRQRRYLIPAEGFYDWAGPQGHKQPYHFRLKGGGLFAFAGMWDRREELETSALITTGANELVAGIHNRMPVLLGADSFDQWLDEEAARERLLALLKPFPTELMEGFAVFPRVNRGGVEGPDLIKPVAVPLPVSNLFPD